MVMGGWTDYVETKRAQVRAGLREELDDLDLPPSVVPALADAGQVNRGVLTLLIGEALGAADSTGATALGVVLELVHRASVIHDDIQDHDRVRRGVATFHVAFGVPMAIAVADVLLSRALAMVVDRGDPDVVADTVTTFRGMARGQLMDIAGPPPGVVTSWTVPAELKTGSLIALAFTFGARSAGAADGVVRAWSRVGALCGSAFQLINDVRNARHQENRTAVAASDLVYGRYSAVRLYAEHTLGARAPWSADLIEIACEAVELEAHRRLGEAHETVLRIGPAGFAADILTVLTEPKASATFTLQDPGR
jgi:geranylgeranyl pyrophosphate synthase